MRPAALALSLLCFGALTAPALAQPPPAVEAERAASDRADDLIKRGNAFAKNDRWSDAEPLYREAWSLKRSYDIAGNLGIAEAALGKNRDAAEHLTFALKSFPANGKAEHRKLLEATLTKARGEIAALAIDVSVGKAEVLVDGRRVGTAPLDGPVFVDPGPHVVEATLAGYTAARTQVDAQKGTAQDVALVLAPGPPTGGQTPDAGGPRKPVIVAGAALGGVGIILGAVFAGLSDAKASDVNAKHDAIVNMGAVAACGAAPSAACQALLSAKQDQAAFANAAAWSFIAGGAVGAATVIYAVAAPRAAKRSGMRVVPLVAADGAGVVLRGEW
jgi:tetratricopeptide (TPR) repeat protein